MDISFIILAQEPYVQNRFWETILKTIGPYYAAFIIFPGVILFAGSILLVNRYRHPHIFAAYSLFLLFPILIAMSGSVFGFIDACYAHSCLAHPAEVFSGFAQGLYCLLIGLLVTFPSYTVLGIAMVIHSLNETPPVKG